MTVLESAPVVLIVDDDEGIRDGLTRLLHSADIDARAYASADDFLAAELPSGPACLLLDVRLPGPSGLDLQDSLAATGRGLPIIFMTGVGTIPMTVRAMKAGAVEFLTKPVEEDALLAAIALALAQDAEARAASIELQGITERFSTLTPREQEVFALTIGGLMNKQLAAELGTTEITAKVHKRRVMEKMEARSLPDLVLMAERLNVDAVKRR